MENAIVLCSGGMDSVVAAHYLKKKLGYENLIILFFNYGQRSMKQEKVSAESCAKKLKARFVEIRIPMLSEIAGSLLSREKNKKVALADLKNSKEESLKWYVPHRNLMFLGYAMSLSESLALRDDTRYDIAVGFKNEGEDSFPDTTPEFVSKINELRDVASEKNFEIFAPLILKDKEDIVALGKELKINLENTWSCYSPSVGVQCGTCLACRLRQEGFYWANVQDATEYKEKMEDFRLAEDKIKDSD